ncbi:1-acyl-sn-glycerol-3-phosphate acyltransferase [Patulibacter defluvii]|uniref:1-acyl-sn-glycerol-3-phosphate acyltransferase n=1 Tax=Patulibacter defluvii TaxID=3095358 RepID=UPI002A7513EB|nr:1-acyl-sn-glycerol-3-phosphate acyltransferase [Patulibacter sp. DM4]
MAETSSPPDAAVAPSPEAVAAGVLGQIADAAGAVGRLALTPVRAGVPGAGGRRRSASDELDDRDSYLLRDLMPVAWIVASLWFRADVRGFHHVPHDRPVLLVGNHHGGNLTPDSFVMVLAFASHFGPERPLHVLVDDRVATSPGLGFLRRLGMLPANAEAVRTALSAGACVLAHPAIGDDPRAAAAAGSAAGYVRLAQETGVPIVPVVSIGGQGTSLIPARGRGLARRLGGGPLGRLAAAGPPRALVGALEHLPLPNRLVVQLLPPIDVAARFGPDADPAAVHAHVSRTMDEMSQELRRRRRPSVLR